MESKGAKDGGIDDAKYSDAKHVAEAKYGDAKASSNLSDSQISALTAHVDSIFANFMAHADADHTGVNADGHPWKLSMKKPELGDLEIYYSKVTGSKYSRWHSICVLPHPMEEVVPALLDVQHRLTWDRGLEAHFDIPVTATGTDVPTRAGSIGVQVCNV